MAKEITMPKLSDTMTEGLFAGWRKNVGEQIERGDVLADVETDKAVMELEAFASGVLLKTMVKNGEMVAVGTVLGLIGEPGEMAEASVVIPVSAPEAPALAVSEPTLAAPLQAEPPATPQPPVDQNKQEYEKASPLVRRMARDQGIDLGQVPGSGPDGRITQEDLAGFVDQQGMELPEEVIPPLSAGGSPQEQPSEPAQTQVTSSMRKAIAGAVTRSWQTIPHFSVSVEVVMDVCREITNELKTGENKVGYNSLLIKACATVLGHFPLLVRTDLGDRNAIDINFAVALPDGLLTPVIRQCDKLTVAEIERESARLIERCKSGRLSSEEMRGGDFTVSNLGMYGVDDFTALITPGQTAILAAGAVKDRPVICDGRLTAAATMRVTLSCDHRAIDGAYAASFLTELRSSLEQPAALLM